MPSKEASGITVNRNANRNRTNNRPKSDIKPAAPRRPAPAPKHAAAKQPPKQYTVEQPGELLAFLLTALSGKGRNTVKSMLARGQIAVDGQAVTAYNYPLQPGHVVSVQTGFVPKDIPLAGLKILHEDDDVIVVYKEAGLLSVAADDGDELTAYRQLMAHVRNRDASQRIFVVHRLDRDTSGVMMFAKSEAIQQALQTTWQDTVRERTYVALVEGQVKKPEGTISSWLKENKAMKMYSSPYPNDGQHAVTHYKVLQSNREFSLLEVQLETGRKNQIRVHMQDIGHPVVGDRKYGSRSRALGRLGLHARVLAFVHPATGKLMRFESDIPKPFLAPFRARE